MANSLKQAPHVTAAASQVCRGIGLSQAAPVGKLGGSPAETCMGSTEPRQLTPEEEWQITCHEAGDAIVGARLQISFLHVERGDGEHGEVHIGVGPIEDPDGDWTEDEISRWQQFYAAGAAAEKLLFGDYREYASRRDRYLHEVLEKRWRPNRSGAWEKDRLMGLNWCRP
jgi:hypothetical protein